MIVSKAYEAGAKYVIVDWDDEATTRIRYEKPQKIPSITIHSGKQK